MLHRSSSLLEKPTSPLHSNLDSWWLVASNSCLCSLRFLRHLSVFKPPTELVACVIGGCFAWLKHIETTNSLTGWKRWERRGQLAASCLTFCTFRSFHISTWVHGWSKPQVSYGEADPAESLLSLHGSARQTVYICMVWLKIWAPRAPRHQKYSRGSIMNYFTDT